MRYHHYQYRTEQTYCNWITRYIKFHNCLKHPREMGELEIESFLSHLASERKVSVSTQRQALNAIVFLYIKVFELSVAEDIDHVRAKKQSRPPVVLTKNEVKLIFSWMKGDHLLMSNLLYGCGSVLWNAFVYESKISILAIVWSIYAMPKVVRIGLFHYQ
ncbi:MAG: phage integrase N-terminal SAM-like domain-containing protein [Methylococcaceae bacterium]|nr:phage integrase N-terminal SAM-like domain-containing protein [Methylococcaceae bacterium]